MVHSPFRSAVSHSRRPEPAADEPVVIFGGPRGSRYRYTAAKMAEVRHLVETTLMTYAEIAQLAGVARGTVWHGQTLANGRGLVSRRGLPTRCGRGARAANAAPHARRPPRGARRAYVRALAAASAVDAARLARRARCSTTAKLATGPNTPLPPLAAVVRRRSPSPRALS